MSQELKPEDKCQVCGRPNPVWFAPNCFAQLAEAMGITPTARVFQPENTRSDAHQPSMTPIPPIPEDLRLDYETLCAPYLAPATLEWAIEREKAGQQFSKSLIERIAKLTAANEELERENTRLKGPVSDEEMLEYFWLEHDTDTQLYVTTASHIHEILASRAAIKDGQNG